MSRAMFYRVCYGAFAVLIAGLATAFLFDRATVIAPQIKADSRLHEVVTRAILESAWTKSGSVCAAAVPRRLVELGKIAPDCDFVSLSYRHRRWRAIVYPSATPSLVFEFIAVRRTSYEMINVHGQDISIESFLKFLVWAKAPLRDAADVNQINTALAEVRRFMFRGSIPLQLTEVRPNQWVSNDPATSSATHKFQLETDQSGRIVSYQRVTSE